jgi:hypothetical protein
VNSKAVGISDSEFVEILCAVPITGETMVPIMEAFIVVSINFLRVVFILCWV